jgi:hypothetical protein
LNQDDKRREILRLFNAGKIISLPDLSENLNEAIVEIHSAFLGSSAYDLSKLEVAAHAFFDIAAEGNASAHNNYFGNFYVLWRSRLDEGRYEDAEDIWRMALAPALSWERKNQGKFVHKGTPFYFWGMTAIMKGNLNKGYALMHQALEEDKRSLGEGYNNEPAFAFATLDYANRNQAFREWIIHQADFLAKALDEYNRARQRAITLDDFRNRFLKATSDYSTVFILSHALSHFIAIDNIPSYALNSQFAGQLEIGLLYDICLVIEAAIRAKNSKEGFFKEQMVFLSKRAKLELSDKKLRKLAGEMISSPTETLCKILDNTYAFDDNTSASEISGDVCAVYCLRNYGAHNLSSIPAVWQRYHEIRQRCLNVLFLAVDTLY